jgi:hypothetical protein
MICQKAFLRRMVLEGEEGNLVKVVVEILEREKEQTGKAAIKSPTHEVYARGRESRTDLLKKCSNLIFQTETWLMGLFSGKTE